MSAEGLTKKQLRKLFIGYNCPICGRRYEDKKDADDCKRSCRSDWLKRGRSNENPCATCRRYPNCPKPCYPKRDWVRHLRKKRNKKDKD